MPDEAFQRVFNVLSRCKRVLLTTHVKPDGDALGSTAAMSLALKSKGIESKVLLLSHLPRKYSFVYLENGIPFFDVEAGWPGESGLGVPPEHSRRPAGSLSDREDRSALMLGRDAQATNGTATGAQATGAWLDDFDALVVMDTGTWSQLPGLQERIGNWKRPKVVIDHHLTQQDWADVKLIDTSAGACGEIVEELLGKWGVAIDHKIAMALFVAIVSDTGWFQYSNKRPQTLRLAAQLMDVGVDTDRIQQLLYRSERAERIALQTRGLHSLRLMDEGRIAVMQVTKSDFVETKSSVNDTEDLINVPLQIRSVEVAALLVESPDGGPIRVSLRSKGQVDVAKFAEQFGGGGHARAAGLKLATSLADARDKVVAGLVNLRMKEEG